MDRETPLPRRRLRTWLRLLRVTRGTENRLREYLRLRHDTTLPRFDVMAALHREKDGLKMSELSGVLRVSNGNVTGIVDRLVGEGLIMRIPVENDRRAMIVRLTDKGCSCFEELAEIHEGWVNGLLGDISTPEAKQLNESLRKIDAHFDFQEETANAKTG